MNIKQLSTFLNLTKTMNFTETAAQIGYAQSTITTQIKMLEDELGTPLFERLGKSISLTAAGKRLIPYAKEMLTLEQKILSNVPEADNSTGILNIGVAESLCYHKLPPLLQSYKAAYPKVDIQMSLINHNSFPKLLQEGTLDLVYTLNPLFQNQYFEVLHREKETLDFFVSPNHPLAQKEKVTETDLVEFPLLLTDKNCNFRLMLLSNLAKLGLNYTVALETSNKEILKQFAITGAGVAFLPTITAIRELKEHTLVKLNWSGAAFPIYSQVITYKGKIMTREMNAFFELLK